MILITGSNSQLAKEFIKEFSLNNINYIALTKEKLNITNYFAINKVVMENNIKIIINCAAYNNVDLAEENHNDVFNVNSNGVSNLTEISEKYNIKLITYSTDFVFNGEKVRPYLESDNVNPVNIYGESKVQGEKVALNYDKSLVIRTSWLYGNGENFCTKVIIWAEKNEEIKIADNLISSPTNTYDLVKCTLNLLNGGKYGLYHVCNGGSCSKYEFAKYLLEKLNYNTKVIPVNSKEFNLRAKRGENTTLNCSKYIDEFGEIPNWKISLNNYIKNKKEKKYIKNIYINRLNGG
ncbi:MAG: dTDP-4-dehydrorhamnose reductase [Fusobacteria bacterium]|nr:dTDP-4-dehydrorhamnose reductase [Fusobacteriota bacterium]